MLPTPDHEQIRGAMRDFARRELAPQAARQLVWHAAALRDAGRPCLQEAAMAKLFASEMAERVCSYGYVSDFPVERICRDVRVCQIYEGTSDVQKILIHRALLQGTS